MILKVDDKGYEGKRQGRRSETESGARRTESGTRRARNTQTNTPFGPRSGRLKAVARRGSCSSALWV